MRTKEYSDLKDMLEAALLDHLPSIPKESDTLRKAMEYSLMAGGKRMRGVLCLASASFCGLDPMLAMPYACAIEFIQTYSLIHDDLPALDNDDLRRGKPTNHKVFGEDMAILAGDGLLSAAFELVSWYSSSMALAEDGPLELKNMVLAQNALAEGIGVRGMVAGQVSDVENAGKDLDPELLDFIHLHKTADFIKASVLCGLYLGGADQQVLDDFREYAVDMGLAFQIADDISDGDQTDECSYVTLHGMDRAKERTEELLTAARASIAKYKDNTVIFNDILDFLEEQIK